MLSNIDNIRIDFIYVSIIEILRGSVNVGEVSIMLCNFIVFIAIYRRRKGGISSVCVEKKYIADEKNGL